MINETKQRGPTDAAVLYALMLQGQMVTREINGGEFAVWKQADEFVMSKRYGHANPRHELLVDATPPERLAAHWDGFCGIEPPAPPKTLAEAVKAAKAVATEAYRKEAKNQYGYLAYREAEIIASSGNGERSYDEPDYLPLSKLNGAYLRNAIECFLQRAPATKEIWICGGFDLYRNFGEYVYNKRNWATYDYEPRVENWDYQVPKELVEQVRSRMKEKANG